MTVSETFLFTFLWDYFLFFFFFQDAKVPGFAIKGCNYLRKHKSALFQIP